MGATRSPSARQLQRRPKGRCPTFADHEFLVVHFESIGIRYVACWFCAFREWVGGKRILDRIEAYALLRQIKR